MPQFHLHRHIGCLGHQIILERGIQQLPIVIIHQLLKESRTNAHLHPAVNLGFCHHWVDHSAAVVDKHKASDLDIKGLFVHLKNNGIGAVASRAVRWCIVSGSFETGFYTWFNGAARRIGFLLDQVRLHGEEKELVDEVTILAKKYGIITPYTSFLILEDEANQVTTRRVERENEIFGRMAPQAAAPELRKRAEESFSAMKSKSGRSSVDASKEVQDLSFARNLDAAQKSDDRLSYQDELGRSRNIMQQIKQVQGRAMYQAGKWWLDPLLQTTKNQKVTRVQFGTQPYFDLVAKKPAASQFLALGKNVRFVMGSEVIEVYE